MLLIFPFLHYFLLLVFIYRQSTQLYRLFLILLSGDVEINSRPRHNFGESFSICYWNLNSVSACNYSKLFSLKVFIAVHTFYLICLSQTFVDSGVAPGDDNLEISSYSLVRSDHPSKNKRGGVCVYYKIYPQPIPTLMHKFSIKKNDKICGSLQITNPDTRRT